MPWPAGGRANVGNFPPERIFLAQARQERGWVLRVSSHTHLV
jgi:hypothetical protein